MPLTLGYKLYLWHHVYGDAVICQPYHLMRMTNLQGAENGDGDGYGFGARFDGNGSIPMGYGYGGGGGRGHGFGWGAGALRGTGISAGGS